MIIITMKLQFSMLYLISFGLFISAEEQLSRNSNWNIGAFKSLRQNDVRSIDKRCAMSNCFNFSRCLSSDTLKIYVYPDKIHLSQTFLYSKLLEIIRKSPYYTENPERACLFVLSIDTIDRDKISENFVKIHDSEIKSLPKNIWDGGRNHLIFNLYYGTYPDYSNADWGFDVGKAMLALASSKLQNFRHNFDLSFPLFHKDHPFRSNKSMPIRLYFPHHDHFLATFKGKRYVYGVGSKTRNILHNLNNAQTSIIATTCKHNSDWKKFEDERCKIDNDDYDKWDYDQLLVNSTFCLIPRGRRLGSYRFLEALRSACIPVILSDEWVLPFSDVIDWSEAVIFGHEQTSLFIYDYLSAIPENRIFLMRQAGQLIYNKYFSSIERIIYSTIEILFERVKRHLGVSWGC